MADDRFSSLFNDPDFSIDKKSFEYRSTSYSISRIDDKAKRKKGIVDKFQEVEDERPKKKVIIIIIRFNHLIKVMPAVAIYKLTSQ